MTLQRVLRTERRTERGSDNELVGNCLLATIHLGKDRTPQAQLCIGGIAGHGRFERLSVFTRHFPVAQRRRSCAGACDNHVAQYEVLAVLLPTHLRHGGHSRTRVNHLRARTVEKAHKLFPLLCTINRQTCACDGVFELFLRVDVGVVQLELHHAVVRRVVTTQIQLLVAAIADTLEDVGVLTTDLECHHLVFRLLTIRSDFRNVGVHTAILPAIETPR